MASNGVAANLLMLAIVAAGLVSLTGLEQEAWPELPFNQIEVSMAYPGATPSEVEESIVVKIEEQVNSLADVKTIRSVAAAGMASVRVELKPGAQSDRVLDDVKSAVSRIQSFPARAERPAFREMTNRQSSLRLIVYGDVSERSLKEVAHRIEDELAALPDVSEVEITGVREYEISIDVPLHRLRALGLTLEDIANAVRRGSLDLSAGSIDTRESQVRVRTLGQRYDQQEFEDIVVLASSDATMVRLGDIAEVHDGFRDTALIVRHENLPAAFVEVYRADGEDVVDVVAAVKEYVESTLVPSLPEGVGITVWNDDSELFDERLDLLIKNGSLGLILVFGALTLFLRLRLAVWVTVGFIVSGLGAFAVMLVLDVPLNSFSLFAFILAIGIVVDDAIVVSENIHSERVSGTPGTLAAIRGTRRIKGPLIFAVLTSVAAFSPLLILPGGIGDIMGPMPIVVIAMLLISLVESLLVLPNHLSHGAGPGRKPTNPVLRGIQGVQAVVDRALGRFVAGPLHRSLRFATRQPGIVLATAIAMLIICASLIPAGIVESRFAGTLESDFVTVTLEMPDGTPAQRTYELARRIEEAGRTVVSRLSQDQREDFPPLLSGVVLAVGQRPRMQGGGLVPEANLNPPANIASIELKLSSARQRQIATETVLQAWRDEVGPVPEAHGVTFTGEVLSLGNPIEILLSHSDPERLAAIAGAVGDTLREFEGVFDVRSDHARNIPEVQLELKPEAETLGLTLEDLAQQMRAAFFGEEALRLQRGREEVRVYARLPLQERDAIGDIEQYLIRTPAGQEVPITQVATFRTGASPTTIERRNGQRVATVTADVDPAVTSGAEINSIVESTVLEELVAANRGMTFSFGGEAQQQFESFDALQRGFILAMIAIFALLAIPLRSYTKPLIIMAVIPFGLIGAILGHLVLGVAFTFVSAMGILGLSGVVVNDSLVMIDLIDQKRRQGASAATAIVEGAKGRFRAIMLTSVTTFLGFTPIIFEGSIQAEFLVNFAASIGFGVLVTTAILMMLVPALTAIFLRREMEA